jgi:hypothetical protein
MRAADVARYRESCGLPPEPEPNPDPLPSEEFLRERAPLEELELEAEVLRWDVARLELLCEWYRRRWQEARAEVLAPIARRERLEELLAAESTWAAIEGAEWCAP